MSKYVYLKFVTFYNLISRWHTILQLVRVPDSHLTAFFNCMPYPRGAASNSAPDATVSTYIFLVSTTVINLRHSWLRIDPHTFT